MKKFIFAALAASVALSPIAASTASAQPLQQRQTTVVKQNGKVVTRTVTRQAAPQYRTWRKGQRFDSRYARNYRQVDYRQHRNLKAPPRGYRYVQSGNDAVLVGITSGVIAAVIAGALR